MEPASSLPYI